MVFQRLVSLTRRKKIAGPAEVPVIKGLGRTLDKVTDEEYRAYDNAKLRQDSRSTADWAAARDVNNRWFTEDPIQKAANRRMHEVDPSYWAQDEDYYKDPAHRELASYVRAPYYEPGDDKDIAAMLEMASTPEEVEEIMKYGTFTKNFKKR